MKMPVADMPVGRRLYLLCWPDSVDWQAILYGLVTSVERGRFWDEKTGNIKDIQAYAREAITLMNCDDLITALQEIRDGILSIEGTQNNILVQATAQASAGEASAIAQSELNVRIAQVIQAQAVANAWSLSIAQAQANVEVRQYTYITLVPYEPLNPPPLEAITEAGFDDVAPSTDAKLCGRAVYIADTLIYLFKYLHEVRSAFVGFGTNVGLGLVEAVIAAVYFKFGRNLPPIPTSKIAAMATLFGLLSLLNDWIDVGAQDAYEFMLSKRTDIICALYVGAVFNDPTPVLREALASILKVAANPLVYRLAMVWLDLGMVGLMYLTPTGQDWGGVESLECNCQE